MTSVADFLGHWSVLAAAWQLATLSAKATVLLALGAALAPLAGRRSAATRHLVWAATLAGVLALPILWAAGPRWTPLTAHAVAVAGLVGLDRASAPGPNVGAVAHRKPSRARSRWVPVPDTVAAAILSLWAAGVGAALVALGRGIAARRGFTRRRTVEYARHDADTDAMAHALGSLAEQLGVRRPVVVWGPAGTMPMTWGVWRPTILLPADVSDWHAAERDAVLRHELAHVRRGDAGWALVAELACAFFWFHPGMWLARAARLRWQERAADGLAVGSGAERHAYAAALVGAARVLARASGRGRPISAAAPAITLHVDLAERLRVLTAPGFTPDRYTRRRRTAILAGAFSSAVGLAALDRARAMPPTAAAVRGAATAARTAPAAFVAGDSTLVVLVPATADADALRGALRRLAREDVVAVYTTDDRAARQLADRVHGRVGGSLIDYERVGMSDAAFAAVLVENAVGANARRTVAVVIEPALVRPFFRSAAAAAGVDVGPGGNPGGRANGALVLTVAPQTDALVRARY